MIKNKKGFTLIEILLYSAIVGTMLVLMVGFLWNIVLGNIKEASYQEVQQNARLALNKITQEIKKSDGLINPLAGDPPVSSLSLSMATSQLNPTIFDIDGGKLRITRGSLGSSYLTSDQTIISNLQFTNLSYSDTPGTIRIEMTIDYSNPNSRTEYQASVNLDSTVSLVPGGAPTLTSRLVQIHYRWRNDDGLE